MKNIEMRRATKSTSPSATIAPTIPAVSRVAARGSSSAPWPEPSHRLTERG